MARMAILLIVMGVAFAIALVKMAAGKVSGNEKLKNVTTKDEAKKVMDKTARGLNWMEKQWEDSKDKAKSPDKKDSGS